MDKIELAKKASAELDAFMEQEVVIPAFLRMTKAAGIPEPRTPQELEFMLETALEIDRVKQAARSGQYPELQQQLGNDFEYVANMAKRASFEIFGQPIEGVQINKDMVEKVVGFRKAAADAGLFQEAAPAGAAQANA